MKVRILILLLMVPCSLFAEESTYELVLAGKSCKEQVGRQQIDCEYRIGKSLHIFIAGIGMPDTAITFMKADFDGDYYGSVGVLHGCVVVKPGKKSGTNHKDDFEPGGFGDYAFVSPKNGKVYRNWEECKAAY